MVQTEKVWAAADELGAAAPGRAQPARSRARQPRAHRCSRCASRATARSSRFSCRSARRTAFRGVVDLVSKKAFIFQTDESGKFTEGAVPADMTARRRQRARGADRDGRRGRREADGEVLRGRHADRRGAGRRACAARRSPAKLFPLVCTSALAQHRRAAAARRDRRLPAVARRPAVQGRSTRTAAEVARAGRREGAAPRRSSGRRSPIRSPAASRCSASCPACSSPTRRSTTRRKDAPERLGHLHAAAGQDADARARDQGRRPRRGRQAEGHADQRHARRQGRSGHLPADQVPRAGARLRDRAEEPRRRGQDQHVDAPARGRGSVDPLQPRSADQGAAARRAGPAAHRGHRRQAEAAVRRRRQPEAAAHPVPRDDQGLDRSARPAQEADRRPRPVRRLQDQGRAAGARRRLRVRRRHLRRLDPAPVRAGGRERASRTRGRAATWPATRWSTSA